MESASLDKLPPTISIAKASEILGICLRSAYRAANEGDLPVIRMGRRLLVPTAELRAMLGPSAQSDAATKDNGGRI